jgi:hypothetical protein
VDVDHPIPASAMQSIKKEVIAKINSQHGPIQQSPQVFVNTFQPDF